MTSSGTTSRGVRGRILLLLGFAVAAFSGGAAVGEPDAAAQEPSGAARPNVVVVMTDDQDVRSLEVMDAVREHLVQQGTTFDNFFATFPLCCPSRATFLTGQYAHNHGVLDNKAPSGGYAAFDDSESLAVWMTRGGYRTGWVGKYLNDYGNLATGGDPHEVPPGWDRWVAPVGEPHKMYDYTLNEDGQLRDYGGAPHDYQTDVFAGKAAEFVRESAPSAEPFFLVMAPLAPHVEAGLAGANPRPAPRHSDTLAKLPYRTPPSFNERDVSDKPSFVRERSRLNRAQREALRRAYFDRRRSLLAVDDAVGRLVDELKRADELDDTLIIYTSDNGFMLGEHRLRGKIQLYEESARVPLVMRGPGVPAGVGRKQLTGNIDVAPSILDAADASPGLTMDGISLFPLAQDPSIAAGRDILLENRASRAVRTPGFMYAQHREGERELYDMRLDPFQLESFHSGGPLEQQRSASIETRLSSRLRDLRGCAGAQCR